MANEGQTPPAGGNSGVAPPPGQSGGTSPGATGREGGENKPDTVSKEVRDAVWADARKHFEGETDKAKKEADAIRKKLAKYETSEKDVETLRVEHDTLQAALGKRDEVIKGYAESRTKALPENLRGILEKATGGDALKTLELLPEFETLAKAGPLKSIGGTQVVEETTQIDFGGIMAEADRGNTKPMREAIKKHTQAVWDKGLQAFMARRGK